MEIRGYYKSKEEALDHTVWTAHFGRHIMACHKTDCRINNVYLIEIHVQWVPVTTAWCVLTLQIEERPPNGG